MSSRIIVTPTTSDAERVYPAPARPVWTLLAAAIGIASVVALGVLGAPPEAFAAAAVITVYAMATHATTRR